MCQRPDACFSACNLWFKMKPSVISLSRYVLSHCKSELIVS